MSSKIKDFNLKNCQHLRKVLVGENVNLTGNIDLTDTPIQAKNDVKKITDEIKFGENIPDGITFDLNNFKNRVKLRGKEIATQTEPAEIAPLNSLLLTENEKNILKTMEECLFWYDEFDSPFRMKYLTEKRIELNTKMNAPTTIPLNENLRLLGEHVLLVNEKLIENKDHFAEIKKNKELKLDLEPRSWLGFYLWLISDMVWKHGEEFWQWRTTSDLVARLVYSKITRVLYRSPSDDKIGSDRMTLHKELINFMGSLHDTVFRRGGKLTIFPVYDDNKNFGEFFNNSEAFCGANVPENKMSEQVFSVFRDIFQEWRKTTPSQYKTVDNSALTHQELLVKNKELQTQLDKLRLLFNSSYPSFWNWIKLRIINEDYSLREDKKNDYLNLNKEDFKVIEQTIQSGALSNEVDPDITQSWTENIKPETKFLSIIPGREPHPLKSETYNDLGKIFDKWRSKLYTLNPFVENDPKKAAEKEEKIKKLEEQIKTKEAEKTVLENKRIELESAKNATETELNKLRASEKYELEANKVRIGDLEAKVNAYYALQIKASSLETQISQINSQITYERTNSASWQTNYQNTLNELNKEKGWWDKWFLDPIVGSPWDMSSKATLIYNYLQNQPSFNINVGMWEYSVKIAQIYPTKQLGISEMYKDKFVVKALSQYYRDKKV